MRLSDRVYFYEGDFVDQTKRGYCNYYLGMASSNFLVVKGKSQILIDSGCPYGPHRARIARELASDGIDLEKTERVVFSHAHPDHTVMAKKMSKRRPLRFYLHKACEPQVRNSSYLFETVFNLPEGVRRDILPFPDWLSKVTLRLIGLDFGYLKAEDFFEDGDQVNDDPRILAVEMPAHSPGHAGFYFPEERIFYSADLFDLRCVDGADVIVASSCYGKALSDLERAASLDAEILVPGHGAPVFGKQAITDTLARVSDGTRRYVEDIMAHLPGDREGALPLSRIQELVFPDAISYNGLTRRLLTYNCLDHLSKQGMVDCLYRGKRPFWYAPRN